MCRGKPPSPIITISDFFYFLKLFSKFGWSFISLWKHFLSQKCFLEKLSRMRPSCFPDLISRPLSSMAVELLWKTTGSRNLGTPMGFICFDILFNPTELNELYLISITERILSTQMELHHVLHIIKDLGLAIL